MTMLRFAAPILVAAFAGCSALALSGCSDPPLIGPCSALKRQGPDNAYYHLALSIMFDHLGPGPVGGAITQQDVDRRLSQIDDARKTWADHIQDACLNAHVGWWLSFEEGETRRLLADQARLNGYSSEFAKEQAEQRDQEFALREKLGLPR